MRQKRPFLMKKGLFSTSVLVSTYVYLSFSTSRKRLPSLRKENLLLRNLVTLTLYKKIRRCTALHIGVKRGFYGCVLVYFVTKLAIPFFERLTGVYTPHIHLIISFILWLIETKFIRLALLNKSIFQKNIYFLNCWLWRLDKKEGAGVIMLNM